MAEILVFVDTVDRRFDLANFHTPGLISESLKIRGPVVSIHGSSEKVPGAPARYYVGHVPVYPKKADPE